MWFICRCFIFVLVFPSDLLAHIVQHSVLDDLLLGIKNDENPYQVTIFMNRKESLNVSAELQAITAKFLQRYPAVVIDVTKISSCHDDRSLHLSVLRNPRHVSLHVVLHHHSNSDKHSELNLQFLVDFFVKVSPKYTRPKCILLCLNCGNESEKFFESVLLYAWSKKFLDFSIINANEDSNEALLYFYNPHYKNFSKQIFTLKIPIFPDKLHNVNGYPLNLSIYYLPPYMSYDIDQNGNLSNIDGPFYNLLLIAMEAIHLSPLFTLIFRKYDPLLQMLELIEKNLLKDTLNMHAVSLLSHSVKSTDILSVEVEYNRTNTIIVVPRLFTNQLKISSDMVAFIVITPLIVSGLSYMVTFLKLTTEHLAIFSIFQAIFGISVLKQPETNPIRIIFLCAVLLSFGYSIDLYSDIVNINVVRVEVPFNSFKEIDESGLKPMVDRVHAIKTWKIENKHMQNIIDKATEVSNLRTCIDIARKNRSAVCITSVPTATMHVQRYVEIKIAKPVIFRRKQAFMMQRASPYIEKFRQVFTRLHESEIHQKLLALNKFSNSSKEVKKNDKTFHYDFCIQLLLILSVGYSFSAFIFLIEQMMKR